MNNDQNYKYIEVKRSKTTKEKDKNIGFIAILMGAIYVMGFFFIIFFLAAIFSGLSGDYKPGDEKPLVSIASLLFYLMIF